MEGDAALVRILNDIRKLIPQFQPEITLSDWEAAPRNAVKEIYPNVKHYGCWFHFSQRVWQRTQKLGLVETFTDNQEFATYVRCLMAIPFLPSDLIQETYNHLTFVLFVVRLLGYSYHVGMRSVVLPAADKFRTLGNPAQYVVPRLRTGFKSIHRN